MFEFPLKYASVFKQCNIPYSRGILLYGFTGCGKTLFSLALSSLLNTIVIQSTEIMNKYVGESEEAVRSLFIEASQKVPCAIVFDEFESIASHRGSEATGITDRIVNQLLTLLDGFESNSGVYVVACTSRPDLIDAALLRSGRLDKHIFIDLPTFTDRVQVN
jgi:peroxin-1